MLKLNSQYHLYNPHLPLDTTNVFVQQAEGIYVRRKKKLYNLVNDVSYINPGGITAENNSTGKTLKGDGTAGYEIDTSGTGPFYNAVTDRWWLVWVVAGSQGAGPQGIFSEGANAAGFCCYFRTGPDQIQIEVRASGATEFTDVVIAENVADGEVYAIACRVTNQTDFACYVNGIQKHTATFTNQIGSKAANPFFLDCNINSIVTGTANPWEGSGTIYAVGSGAVTNADLKRWSSNPMELFKPPARIIPLEEPAVGAGSKKLMMGLTGVGF